MLNTHQRRKREANLGFWLPRDEAEAFRRAAVKRGGVTKVLREYVRRFLRRDKKAA